MNKNSRLLETRKATPRWHGFSSSVVSGLTAWDTDRDIIQQHPISVKSKLSLNSTAARYAVSLKGSFHLSIRKKINNKNLAMLTTCIQSHETECVLRANGRIKESVSGYPEGKQLVPVPMQDIGCGVDFMGESGLIVT